MNERTWNLVREAFAEAAGRQGEARESFLRTLQAEVADEVRTLLAADEEAGVFLRQPDSLLAPGTILDRYEIVDLAARGGMGEVYRAVRIDGSGQQVAIKILGPAFLLREAERHFSRERRILAQLSHPNIVRMLDSGDNQGMQYLAMEWVDGVSVDMWARTASTGERLGLFEEICDAVHAAHQSLIVHRDLKPANILVTPEGQPKLLDFGIARLLDFAGEMPAATRTTLRVMTLAYCSPEQARDLHAGIPSDIYSLGLILYELLTGEPAQVVASLPLDDAIRKITTEDPPRSPAIARDLDAIVRKAVAKEPARRYASALEMGEDVRRFRQGYPVLAQPASLGYAAAKFVRRNKAAVTAGAIGLLAALLGLGGFVLQYRRAQHERGIAERRFAAARQMAQLLMFDAPGKLAGIPGTIDARKWMAERATAYLKQLSADVQGDPDLALSVARGYRQVAFQQFNFNAPNLNDPWSALVSLEQGAAILNTLPHPGPEHWREMILNRLERPYFVLSRPKDAMANEDSMAELADRIQASTGKADVDLRARIWFRQATNIARSEQQRLDLWSKLESYYASRLAEKPADPERMRALALVHKNVSGVYGFRGQWEQAVLHDRQALALDERRAAGNPGDPNTQMDLSFDKGRLGQDLCEMGRCQEGIPLLRSAVAIRRALVAREPEDKRAPERLAWMLAELGRRLLRGSESTQGEKLIREALAIREKLGAPGAGENSLPDLHQMLAQEAEKRGDRLASCQEWLASARTLPAETGGAIFRDMEPGRIRARAAACEAR